MDLRQLEILQTIAETGSFTACGRKLHVSQSALSAQIKQLEQQLGQPLFARTGRTLSIGDIHLSLFPVLGARLREIKLGNAPGFGDTPFAEVGEAEVGEHASPGLAGIAVVAVDEDRPALALAHQQGFVVAAIEPGAAGQVAHRVMPGLAGVQQQGLGPGLQPGTGLGRRQAMKRSLVHAGLLEASARRSGQAGRWA